VFLPISTHFTATPGIPSSSDYLKVGSFHTDSRVELGDLLADLPIHLRALYAQ
jgi:hypothetical protein